MIKKNNNKLIWNSYNSLLLSVDINRVRKLLARYELFIKLLKVPFHIIECGVFQRHVL